MILHKLSREKRETAIWWIFTCAQLAFVTSSILARFTGEQFSFLIGLLSGIAVVGNILFLSQYKTLKRN